MPTLHAARKMQVAAGQASRARCSPARAFIQSPGWGRCSPARAFIHAALSFLGCYLKIASSWMETLQLMARATVCHEDLNWWLKSKPRLRPSSARSRISDLTQLITSHPLCLGFLLRLTAVLCKQQDKAFRVVFLICEGKQRMRNVRSKASLRRYPLPRQKRFGTTTTFILMLF